jgi:hypothetical protein
MRNPRAIDAIVAENAGSDERVVYHNFRSWGE